MEPSEKEILPIQKISQDLATFAVDRNDLKTLLASLPPESSLNLTALEYELQILKILTVGWAISFFMPTTDENKQTVNTLYWEFIKEISQNISSLTETSTGTSIDYFNILKERLDSYLKEMQDNPNSETEPASVMGPAFAEACKAPNDPIAILIGTKMFTLTLGSVKEYLNAVEIDETKQSN
ncbi:MAG: hypothetical protein GY729_20200 [Desulfobacteraceae bacterium]|nr:hypothetical protein [Desulfobacteraceae bacterium]